MEFKNALYESQDLWMPSHIKVMDTKIDALEFLREFVALNVPVLIKGGCTHWPAYSKWNREYLASRIDLVTVAVTPNGLADSIVDGKFMLPFEKRLSLSEYFDYKGPLVYYCQHQNNSLNTEYNLLASDVSQHAWAQSAFGIEPDATNMWIGSEKSVSSCHRDPYENIYSVVKGTKVFTLLPPIATPFLGRREFDVCRYDEDMNVIDQGYKVPWVTVDPDQMENEAKALARPITVRVEAGDVLYLPSMWYHKVKQEGECIAVNHWYDMKYDARHLLYSIVDQIKL